MSEGQQDPVSLWQHAVDIITLLIGVWMEQARDWNEDRKNMSFGLWQWLRMRTLLLR